jgi:hypothetical protein
MDRRGYEVKGGIVAMLVGGSFGFFKVKFIVKQMF